MMSRVLVSLLLSAAIVSACSSGSRITDDRGTDPTTGCTGNCFDPTTFLTAGDVQTIISQAVGEAQARGVANATIAVIDRVGNVLAVYRRGAAPGQSVLLATRVDGAGEPVLGGGLEGIRLPVQGGVAPLNALYIDGPAAISKAITATYFSTEGSAISTRTASQLIQDHFNPGEANTPGGPLFGVPFSFLACSEIGASGAAAGTQPGPQRAPLGYAGDPGGFPLYKGGTVVGGIGVISDGLYSIDENVQEEDANLDDEAIAFAGTFGFGAPAGRRADLLGLDGKTGRYTDIEYEDLASDPQAAAAVTTAGLVNITGYYQASDGFLAGTAFGTNASGIRPATAADFPDLDPAAVAALDAYVLSDAAGNNRYRPTDAPRASTPLGGNELTPAEVQQLLAAGINVAARTRSAIRFPYGSKATMSVVVVDHLGKILGIARSRDATIEGTNVALQKTRNAAFFSSTDAGAFLTALPPAQYLSTTGGTVSATPSAIGGYVTELRNFVGDPDVLGAARPLAWSSRAVNNFSHPNYPDSVFGAPKGPFSKPGAELGQAEKWSAFNSGLPLDLQLNSILRHLLFIASGGAVTDVQPSSCAGTDITLPVAEPRVPAFSNALSPTQQQRLGDGIVLKPGGFPIYRNGVLIGAFGAAGDGTEQDDIVGFLGLYEGQQALIEAGNPDAPGHAPPALRVDSQLAPLGIRPRYVVCPQSPLITGNSEGVCNGK